MSTKSSELTASDIKRYHIYEAKRPRAVGSAISPRVNDRMVLYISPLGAVQYDGPTVKIGQRMPMVSMKKFLKWAGRDITDHMPEDDWRAWPPGSEDVQQSIK